MLIPVVLSGGSGTRLWPLSRAKYPKQFLDLFSDKSMIQETVLRLEGLENLSQPVIICNADSRFIVAHQMMQIDKENAQIILEPMAKSTLPAIAAAAYKVFKENPDDILFVLPSDHTIKNIPAFHQAIKEAQKAAMEGNIVTFGINPDRPETGYGYIQFDKKGNNKYFPVSAFKEKPDLETAKKYLAQGNYVWNSGMFMFKASSFLDELEKYQPEIKKYSSLSVDKAKVDLEFLRLEKESFEKNTSISIDYGLMEKTSKAVVVPMSADWSDVGAWDALWEYLPKDEKGNYVKGDVTLENTENCYVLSQKQLVTAAGVKDLIIVDTKDALLVADKKNISDIKPLFETLKKQNRREAIQNRVDYRPWGNSDSIENSDRYKVKHITVNPGEELSLHYHLHRSEHWVVVNGTATITIGEHEKILTENQSLYIPLGTVHSIANRGKVKLEIIEIQTGTYLEEDDIIRIKDNYGRA
ncbi:MAG: mannose-1-phosphate guanylyltransferase/mannose-6-phosphate isomerase [Treponema sp.]|nr:mannose-1-phosphate guanylyltransferase/mannose-6-phosphate isomerase [Treponema sp.]